MSQIMRDAAIEIARQALQVPESSGATAWRVRRLDRADDAYYLVVFGEPHSTEAVAAIDARTGVLRGSARLSGGGSPIAIDEQRARELAGDALQSDVEMVWSPSPASRSPLYPFWQVETDAGPVYVNQQGHVFTSLEPSGPGGSRHT